MDSNIAQFVSAIIGGVLVGFFTLAGVWLAYKNEKRKRKEELEAQLQSFYQATLTEIKTLWQRYEDAVGSHMDAIAENAPFLYYWDATQDYFAIFKRNSHLIGHVSNSDLRQLIVKVYVNSQSLIDTYRFNNKMVARYEDLQWAAQSNEQDAGIERASGAVYQMLVDYAKHLKKLHSDTKTDVRRLIDLLHEEISAK